MRDLKTWSDCELLDIKLVPLVSEEAVVIQFKYRGDDGRIFFLNKTSLPDSRIQLLSNAVHEYMSLRLCTPELIEFITFNYNRFNQGWTPKKKKYGIHERGIEYNIHEINAHRLL